RFAPVGRLVEAAIRRITPKRARHGRKNRVAALRADRYPRDALRFLQTDIRPGFAAVGRFINPIADRDAVSRPRFAASDPNVLRIGRIDRDRADRLNFLLVENGTIARAAVIGFPNAAARRADDESDFTGRLMNTGDRRDSSAHRRGSNVARAKAG